MTALLLATLASSAWGADWITLNNTEPDGSKVRIIGFAQPRFSASTIGEVTGFTGGLADYEGEVPLFNRSYGAGPVGVGLQRARLGVRGPIGETDFSAFLLVEMGDNGITRSFPMVVTDAAVAWNPTPLFGARLGLQKVPMMEETWPAVPVNLEWVSFSNTALKLTGENPVSSSAYAGPFYAFRDISAQVYGVGSVGRLHLGYVAQIGQGAAMIADPDLSKDVAGRLQAAWVLEDGGGPFRKEVSLAAWGLTGGRTVDSEDVLRTRVGAALRVELGTFWTLVEGVYADGAVELGARPPFPGEAIVMAADGQGAGIVASLGGRHTFEGIGQFGLKARFDRTSLWTDDDADQRDYTTVTGGIEYDPIPKVRVLATYEHRIVEAPYGSGDLVTLLDQVGDRIDLQVTVRL